MVWGPYAYTRNPLYLGSFVIGLGAVAAGGRLWFALVFAVFFAFAYGQAMVQEERTLEQRFGARYRRYAQAVPNFVPWRRRYRSPDGFGGKRRSFSLARYKRNKEYEAALGALAGFLFLTLKMLVWPNFS